MTTGAFSDAFRDAFWDLLRLRRDVRHFRSDPVDDAIIDACLKAFHYAPSVGLSQPWRIINVTSEERRRAVIENFERCNCAASKLYSGDRAELYGQLKLAGLREAPVHLAIFSDNSSPTGHGLGKQTMPETLAYSVSSAIMLFWLATRSYGLGLGWVSILDKEQIHQDLDVTQEWDFIAYLCLGWPQDYGNVPELEKRDWEKRHETLSLVER